VFRDKNRSLELDRNIASAAEEPYSSEELCSSEDESKCVHNLFAGLLSPSIVLSTSLLVT
jgi:hypothetical protein